MVRTRSELSTVETLEELADVVDDVPDVTATLHRADDSETPGGHDTVTVSAEPGTADLRSVLAPVDHESRLRLFAVNADDATVVDPDDLSWV